jgi:hypothetical protein
MKKVFAKFLRHRFTSLVLLLAAVDMFIGGVNGGLLKLTPLAAAQSALTQTTLSAAAAASDTTVTVASVTGITATNYAAVDKEIMLVQSVDTTNKILTVSRGATGSKAAGHVSGATVSVSAPNNFLNSDPTGTCTSSSQPVLPQISIPSGRQFNCINGQWMIDGLALPFAWSDCQSAVSGNSTGTNGYTVAGASNTPVVQAQTSVTGTNTHTYVCKVQIETALLNRGISITDFVFYYGVQSGALGTQAAVLASGTFNGSTVFSTITYPTAGASETASTVTPVRADSGTLVIAPVAASFNTATTTAGAFYTAKFTPAAAIGPLSTDQQDVILTVTLQNTATTATITNSPGGILHYAVFPL